MRLVFGDFCCCFIDKVYSHMKELEIELPGTDDNSTIARVKQLHFYSVREEFLGVWKHHEQFLLEYEERLVRRARIQAQIGNFF